MNTQPRVSLSLVNLYVALLLLTALAGSWVTTPLRAEAQTTTGKFSQKAFESVWKRTDQPVAVQRAGAERSWYWGPEPLSVGLYEPYTDAPYGQRLVQYFDKTRMEINNPASGLVTNGLLTTELITGRVQEGDDTFNEQELRGADLAVIGDPSNASPTYRQLNAVFNLPESTLVSPKVGEPITRLWYKGSQATNRFENFQYDPASQVAVMQKSFGIPQAFWEFMNRQGTVYNGNSYVKGLVSDWQFSIGFPVTEAYWAQVVVGGVEKEVLFQAFERRVLTYTPSNPSAYQVEMGNVGQHYVQWRYRGSLPQSNNSLLNLFTTPVQPQWYKTSAVLNIRTAPTTDANIAFNSQSRPFVTQLQAGDRIKVLRTVKGEEVEPGNDRWHQVYEKPDLFVYAKYTELLDMPTFPAPASILSNSGLWVAVSLETQMMAVYNGSQRVFTTLIASGRTGYETVEGNFRAIGGYRPQTQTMEGGNRAAGNGYKLEEVRYVTYFYLDFAIHGSYWHAKYGLAPQSHGCVNATVYDASLIYQLPVGTPVQVY